MKFIKAAFILLVLPATFFAQGGSVYTRRGLGDLNYFNSARRLSIGELGAAVYDANYVSTYNPASWSRFAFSRFEVGLNYKGLDISSSSGNKNSYYANTEFSGFSLGIPLHKGYGLSFAAGIVPFTSIRYSVKQQVETENSYTIAFEGKGGLSKIFAGLSYSLPFDINVGAALNYYTGNLNYFSSLDYTNSSYYGMQYKRLHKLSGLGGTFGIITPNIAKHLGTSVLQNIHLGLILDVFNKFEADTLLTVTSAAGGTQQLATGKSSAKLPYKVGVGLSFSLNEKYLFALDYLFQPWEQYEFGNKKQPDLKNLNKFSLGFEYSNPKPSPDFWEQVAVRGGFSFEQTQYIINGTEINQVSLYTGLSIPLDLASSIDLGLQLGMRGSEDNNLLKEKIAKLNITINFGELWFIRSQF